MFTHVLYHANCIDGFTGAWVARKVLGDGASYIPIYFGNSVEKLPPEAEAIMIDCAYSREDILSLRGKIKRLAVLDHHVTHMEALEGLPDTVFDMNKSGAMLAWNYFMPRTEAPLLVKYVQDRDLWSHKLPATKSISAYINGRIQDWGHWDELERELEERFTGCIDKGETILWMQDKYVESIVSLAFMTIIDGHKVPAVNTPIFLSDVGHALCLKYPDAPFAACYFENERGKRRWSLRSNNGFDCSAIAKKFGGGGHRAACGYTEERTAPVAKL